MPTEKVHDVFGGVGVVAEDRSEPVEEESKRHLKSCNGIFFEQSDEGVDQAGKPLVAKVWVEPGEG